PPQLGRRRQWRLVGFLAADQISAHRHHGPAPCGPECGHDVGGARTPIEPRDDRCFNVERVHQREDVDGQGRLLAVAHGIAREKPCGPVAPQKRHDRPVARRRERESRVGVAVNVVRPAVEEDDGRSVIRPCFDVPDVEHARIDLLQGSERRVAHGAQRTLAIAVSITSVTACGWEIMITCDPSTSVIVAPARSAMERTTSVPAALSPVATTAHEGNDFHAGGPEGSENARSAIGRWMAAITAACASDRSAANASWVFEGAIENSVPVPLPAGYWCGTRAEFSTLSFDPAVTSPSRSPSSGAKAAT